MRKISAEPPDNDPEIEKKIQALKKDWPKLKTPAQRFPRVDEIKKLGRSIRKIAKRIGVDEGTLRKCSPKRSKSKDTAKEIQRRKIVSPKAPAGSTRGGNTVVSVGTPQTSDPPLFTDAEKAILRKKLKKVDPNRIKTVLNIDRAKPEPEPERSSPPETQAVAESFIERVTRKQQEEMKDFHRQNIMSAEAMRDPQSKRS